ncbi:uncharacterized protein LOC119076123 [Bradysia coprophila]|uniref:uncharacterized protein LOC119076123 n=1 Tax=Bradysia coprophila TaxID=38358 RepID=UPI00187DA171|nr:uncharacterized protein LOC119076123 [Bradysia coprophila]
MSNVIWWIFQMVIILLSYTHGENVDSKCPGPLAYYKALGCKPVYEATTDECPYRFDCDFLKARSRDKCYVNGKAYSLGEHLRDEDANPCDIGCVCRMGYDGVAAFVCAELEFSSVVLPGCYERRSPLDCNSSETVCPENPEDRPTCIVNGTTYKDGEYFTTTDPEQTCICGPGYKGENIEPFCAYPKRPYCDPYFNHASDIVENCAPVYYSNQSPQTDCSVFSRCQNKDDKIIRHGGSELDKCQFGSLVLSMGDELNQSTDYSSVCVKCVCEVPPTPTCQRLPDEECDVTNHPPFVSQ